MSLGSCLYRGWVRHRRRSPVGHTFRYRVMLVGLDLGELESAFRGRWLWSARRPALARFKRTDYLEPHEVPLEQAVRERVRAALGRTPTGRVRMVGNLRYLGFVFNPVTFYVCLTEQGRIDAVVAEITNTPWRERHVYVIDGRGRDRVRVSFDKDFHVSPFMSMNQRYDWMLSLRGGRLCVHMRNLEGGRELFDATLVTNAVAWNGRNLAWALVRYPLTSVRVVTAIYWQAFRLWRKGVPFHRHPKLDERTVAS